MIDLRSQSLAYDLQATFDFTEKSHAAPGAYFHYYNGKRWDIAVESMPCVAKATVDFAIVGSDKWKVDFSTAKHLKENATKKEYFLEYFKHKNDGFQYTVVMDWFDYTLKDFIKAKGNYLPESLALKIYYQIVLGISYMEEAGVIHRDINPDNIAVIVGNTVDDLKVKIFNYTFALVDSLGNESAGGDIEYMHTIMLRSSIGTSSFYNSCVDYWSATVLLYTMLFGRPPFMLSDSLNKSTIFDKVQASSGESLFVPQIPAVSYGIVNFLKRILNTSEASNLDCDTILDDQIFTSLSYHGRSPMMQSVINKYETTNLLFKSLRMSHIPRLTDIEDSEKMFINKLDLKLNDERHKVIGLNRGIRLLNEYFDSFSYQYRTTHSRHIRSIIALIIMLRG